MDADGNVIPIVEDDQGEGMKDPLTIDDLIKLSEEKKKSLFKSSKKGSQVKWTPPKQFNRHR